MKFMKFKLVDGTDIVINMNYCVCLSRSAQKGTVIEMIPGQPNYFIHDSLEEVGKREEWNSR